MVLQQNSPIQIWGNADPGGKVVINFAGRNYSSIVQKTGKWRTKLKALPAGGPFNLTVMGMDTLIIKDVMVGEVWICSGQSNMEWQVKNSQNVGDEIANANHPDIRMFTVERIVSDTVKNNCNGEWQVCSSETVGDFSAVGYFFGRELHQKLDVPVGMIHTSWGGTPAEAWTSWETLAADSNFVPILERYQDAVGNYPEKYALYQQQLKEYENNPNSVPMYQKDSGNMGNQKGWAKTNFDDQDWQKMTLPMLWESMNEMDIDGAVWFRKTVNIPENWAGKEQVLELGAIDDFDITYFNGSEIGSTGEDTPRFWELPRKYSIPAELVRPGKAEIAVRVFDHFGGGGFAGFAKQMKLKSATGDSPEKIQLSGEWKFKVEVSLDPEKITGPGGGGVPQPPMGPGHPHTPAGLYNAMLYPLAPYTIKGAIWYQGETNAGRAYQYRKILPAMITDWRKLWKQGNFPFGVVQLANHMSVQDQPLDSDWAELREAQALTAKNLVNTGLAVTIDIGEANDIHPKNKQDVGNRLALWALAKAYRQPIVYSGPVFQSMKTDSNKIVIAFNHVADSLKTKENAVLTGFSIAGKDQNFVWANAEINGHEVIVWSDEITDPVAVRYAWANNPMCNLYNSAGLPAAPFRTDDWHGLTHKRR